MVKGERVGESGEERCGKGGESRGEWGRKVW